MLFRDLLSNEQERYSSSNIIHEASCTMTFQINQQVALALVPKITACLSTSGSFWIVVEVLADKSKRGNVFHRLILGMSLIDLLGSFGHFASTWPIPYMAEDVVWALGNDNICAAQGVLIQISIASPM